MRIVYTMIALTLGVLMTGCDNGSDDGLYTYNSIEGVMMPSTGGQFDEFEDNPFVLTKDEPISTFSVDADGASYGIMRRMLLSGYDVPKSSVRIEEYLNYFTFDYATPTGDHTTAINAEIGPCPWNKGHKLLRLGIKGKN